MKKNIPAAPCLLPVIHIADDAQALRNAKVAIECGASGIFLICHRDTRGATKLRSAVAAVRQQFPELWIGVNILGMGPVEAIKAIPAQVDGLWVDFIGIEEGRVFPEAEEAQWLRRDMTAAYFGSVAFKYQAPVQDLEAMTRRCEAYTDVMTTSGDGTGEAPGVDKIRRMSAALKEKDPTRLLAIASGITPENVDEFLPYADVFLVATGIGLDFHNLDPERTAALAAKINAKRNR